MRANAGWRRLPVLAAHGHRADVARGAGPRLRGVRAGAGRGRGGVLPAVPELHPGRAAEGPLRVESVCTVDPGSPESCLDRGLEMHT